MGELRDLLSQVQLHMGFRGWLLVDSNSLTPRGPLSKQNRAVLFYFNNFAHFCKRLSAPGFYGSSLNWHFDDVAKDIIIYLSKAHKRFTGPGYLKVLLPIFLCPVS